MRAHLEAARQRLQEVDGPRQQESSRRAAAARERAARQKVERLELALQEMAKVQAGPQAHAEPSERRVSETEPEARIMKESNGGCGPCHNVRISTDPAHGIIVAASARATIDHRQSAIGDPSGVALLFLVLFGRWLLLLGFGFFRRLLLGFRLLGALFRQFLEDLGTH